MDLKTAVHTSIFSIVANGVLAVVKAVFGVLGHSHAMIADAIESSADFFSSLLVLAGLKVSSRPPDENHPYGHGRYEILSTFSVIGFLVISAGIIAYNSVVNLIERNYDDPAGYTLFILGAIILFKEFSFRYVYRKGKQTNSSSLMADAWHHRADAITSILAFTGISLSIFLGLKSADNWAALVASCLILYNAYRLFRPVLGEISDEQLYDDLIEEIREIALTVPGVVDTEKCHVRKMGMVYYVDLHMIVDGNITVHEGHHIAHRLKDEIIKELPEVADVLVHTEPDRLEV